MKRPSNLNRVPVGIRLHPETVNDLTRLSEEMRTDKTAIIERALYEFFQRQGSGRQGGILLTDPRKPYGTP